MIFFVAYILFSSFDIFPKKSVVSERQSASPSIASPSAFGGEFVLTSGIPLVDLYRTAANVKLTTFRTSEGVGNPLK